MVAKKKLDSGFNGYQAPVIPRAPRSIRSSQRRSPHKNLAEDSKLCAFELLAAVAGKLLLENESSASSNVADGKSHLDICSDESLKEQPIDNKALKSDSFDHGHGSCADSAFVPEIPIQDRNLLSVLKGKETGNDSVLEQASVLASSDVLTKVECDKKLENYDVKNADGTTSSKVGISVHVGDGIKPEIKSGNVMHSEGEKIQIDDLTMANTSAVKNPVEECVHSNMLINSDSSVQLPLYRDPIPDALLQKQRNTIKLGIRDDDDNLFGCIKSSTVIRPYRPQARIGQRRVRKMLTSKYRKVAPKLKSHELYNIRNGVTNFYQYRKRIYTHERCQQEPIKRRKLSNKNFAVAYDQETSSDSISKLPEKAIRIDKSSSSIIVERESGSVAKVKGHQKTTDSHVKLSIKSFRVPELYLEIPETASVGSLKRTVMEAVATILGSGMRVGVVLQGKKVRDDNRTLKQAGISQSSNLDTLGFTLEPSFTHVSSSMTTKKIPTPLLPSDVDQKLPRCPATPIIDSGISNALVDPLPVSKFDDDMDNNEYVSDPQTPINESMDEAILDSKALVPTSPMNVEAMPAVPTNPKSKRNELSQRRIRRPFSVTEVEALVEAVEKLGTGRWRDVKISAFENADHRTYVDLKDKWKTLVHTASISPHQRRGEPVPQDLLDRVLCAHSYWSQYQPKQHAKHLLDSIETAESHDDIADA